MTSALWAGPAAPMRVQFKPILRRTSLIVWRIRSVRRTSIFCLRSDVYFEHRVTGGCAIKRLLPCPDCSDGSFCACRTSEIHSSCKHRSAYHTTRAESHRKIYIGRSLFQKHSQNKEIVLFVSCLLHWSFSLSNPPWKIISFSESAWAKMKFAHPTSFGLHLSKAFLMRKVTHYLFILISYSRFNLSLFILDVQTTGSVTTNLRK